MKRLLGAAGIAAALAIASPALADHAAELAAQTLYDKALELMKAGKPASACPLLSESQRLDPAAGTQYRLAECFEKTGRTEAAWRLYTEVAEASKKAGRKDREAQARERAEIVRKLLPHLTITVPPELARTEGLAVTCDGKPVPREEWNLEIPVAPGEHTVEVRATRKKAWQGTITARLGAPGELRVPPLEDMAVVEAHAQKPDVALPVDAVVEDSGRGPNKIVVIAGAALTVVGLGIGTGLIVSASAKEAERDRIIASDPRKDECFPGSHKCLPAVYDADAAKATLARIALASYIAAGVIGAGTLTYALFPRSTKNKEGPKASMVAGPGIAVVTLSGTW
jgi:hypothetical protein